ncbi:hypothetical protein VTP01DRAFT_8950 [Rhizomucor pusillus]|uniref:uncharacterized protein n=1 Tax=Rhizomucor pusillus TaxID=4840 RepID=UPI003743B10E
MTAQFLYEDGQGNVVDENGTPEPMDYIVNQEQFALETISSHTQYLQKPAEKSGAIPICPLMYEFLTNKLDRAIAKNFFVMPPALPLLAVNARVSVAPRYLRTTPVYELLRSLVVLDAPRIRLHSVILQETVLDGKPAWTVKLDQLLDLPVDLLGISQRGIPRSCAAAYLILDLDKFLHFDGNSVDNIKTYRHEGPLANLLLIDFRQYMNRQRFDFIMQMHIYYRPGAARGEEKPFYQFRDFVKTYNDNFADALTPGRYLCVDESMCQWLGKRMPFLKKVVRKPHPVDQEYKTLADAATNCIIRVDVNGDTVPQEFDDIFSMKTVVSVAKLTKPWFILAEQ